MGVSGCVFVAVRNFTANLAHSHPGVCRARLPRAPVTGVRVVGRVGRGFVIHTNLKSLDARFSRACEEA